ncbi:MAG: endonuclease [Bacteroidetes bacterium]|nr:endonuclease [Bacteroidota bacterium]
MKGIPRGLLLLLFSAFTISYAQIPAGYYTPATGLTGTALQQALHDIIDNHTVVSYASLQSTWFQKTDKKTNGKVWDMYSDIPGGTPPYEFSFIAADQCGAYSGEGDCYNREHTFPQSWFNGASPMYSDIFHLYPTDGYVNGRRSNYPHGKVGTATWTSLNGGKLGNCVSPGYGGVVFEPRDEYKGDFARSYLYMETRYFNEGSGWDNTDMTTGSQLKPWAQTQMLLWNVLDPVSPKEIARNDSIYKLVQHNRNPFIDHPEYAAQIWPAYAPQPGTYTWNVASGSWSSSASWTPARTVAIPGDILIFDGSVRAVSSVTVDFTAPQSVARLRVINNANVTFTGTTAAGLVTIGVTGAAPPQLEVASGSTLTVNSTGVLSFNLPSGYSAGISGNILFQNAAHQLTGTGAGSIVFNSGSVFTAGTGFSGAPFGTTASGAVTFAGGSSYVLESGLPPFGAVAPASVVVFQSGSLYKHKANSAPSLSGRTYSNFEIDSPAFNQSVTAGTSACTVDNLTVTNALLAGFDFPGGCTIRGNLQVIAGTLRFNPAPGTLKFDGTTAQTISGAGSLEVGANCNVSIGTASITLLNRNLSLGKDITILQGGTLTINPGVTLTVNGVAVIN